MRSVAERNLLRVCLMYGGQLTGHPHENLARLIFIELNDAWSEFEETGMKPLYS